MPRGPSTLILVPTTLEQELLDELGGFVGSSPVARCGFGPVSAAARTAQLLGEQRPKRVLLVGIAGSLAPARAGLAEALLFSRVRLDGVGAGQGSAFVPPSTLGLAQWEGAGTAPIEDTLDLYDLPGLHRSGAGAPAPELLTVCATAASPDEARARRERYPAAVAEDMEGFGAALACRLYGVPLTIVRGLSNLAGERDKRLWRVREALAAARTLAIEWLARADWSGGSGGGTR